MTERTISAVIGILLLGIMIDSGGLLYIIGIMCMNIFALWELKNALKERNINIFFMLIMAIILAFYMTNYTINSMIDFLSFYLVFIIMFIFLNSMINNSNENRLNDIVYSIFSFIYTLFFSYFVYIRNLPDGKIYVWWIFIMTWACDTGAFFIGNFFGKRKLSYNISPNKTIEGSIGGIVSSVFLGLIFSKIFIPEMPVLHIITLGILIGVFSQLGDLSASLIKRFCSIKDFSNIIPGHGGILDRFDSALFSFPIAYYYIVLIIEKDVV